MQNGSLENHAYTAKLDNELFDNTNQPTAHNKSETDTVHSTPNTSLDSQYAKTEEVAFEDGPPSKRRKTADTAPSQAPSAKLKLPSPPWKRFAPEGPSTFEENGKRKSARTNRVPLELQPQGDKRQTRARLHQQSQSTKNKYASASNYASKSSVNAQHPNQANGKRSISSGKASAFTHPESPSKGGAQNGNKISPATHTPAKRQYRRRTIPAIAPSPASSPSAAGLQSRRAGRTSEKRIARPTMSHTLVNGRSKSQEEVEEDSDDAGEDEDDDEEMESDSEVPIGDNYKPQRLNLRVRLPSAKIQHPEQVPRARRFASFRDWFEGEGSQDPDTLARKPQDKIQEEADLRRAILEEARPGGLLSREKSSLYVPEAQEEPPRQYAHYDHLVAHMSYFRKLLQRENDAHRKQARALAHEAAELWKARQPKTEEEIQQEREAAYRAVYKQVRRDLQHKWDMVSAEVDRRRLQQWEEEQQLLGKEALNKVLEKSSKLLDSRRRRSSSSAAGSSSGERHEGSDKITESTEASGESQDEDNMSSSSQSDHGGVSEDDAVDDDEGLSREQLLQKYAMVKSPSTSVSPILANRKAQVHDPGGATTAAQGIFKNDSATPLSATVDGRLPASPVEVDEVAEVLIDNSDESTDMDDDIGNSNEDGLSGLDSGDDDGSDTSGGKTGLLGFFTENELLAAEEKAEIPQMQHQRLEENIEESSFVPNAAQVQTPSASNSEEPANELLKTVSAAQVRDSSPLYNLMNVDSVDHVHGDSLPTTPVSTKPIKTPVPSLLRGTLREYQHFGLDWLAGLYANGTNGILADEMGLGKTIQTISLLAHLAVHHEVWGPHLIIVPTSVMLNWEMEFKKFLPGFKVLTYYGTQEERRQKRQGWVSDSERYNVWITSYQLASKDEQVFKRRAWHYMILDEAHNIKNFRSKRWQILLTFNTKARLLLTGTPLQNNLTELWSLLFFLMPADSADTGMGGFADLQEFSSWFRKPVEQILEHGRDTMDDDAKAVVAKLHKVLRPYLLRRLKADVEKQMPGKYEHVVYCRLSKRQRYLYDGFMSRAQTKETLASGNYLSIINCLMQLRKVCNHPDLFETRQIVTSFAMPKSAAADFEIKELLVRRRLLREEPMTTVNLNVINLLPGANESLSALDTIQKQRLGALGTLRQLTSQQWRRVKQSLTFNGSSVKSTLTSMENAARQTRFEELRHAAYLTSLKSQRRPLYSSSLVDRLTVNTTPLPSRFPPKRRGDLSAWMMDSSPTLVSMTPTLVERSKAMETTIRKFACVTPAVAAYDMAPLVLSRSGVEAVREVQRVCETDAFHEARMRLSIAFPDKRLLQYDCGKLQRLDALLRQLQSGGHRALIFTQMTRVLDILEQFLNIHGHRYLRLDGSTKIEQRQLLMDRFNNDPRILVFILSSRSGGLGINLTGADSVIFYDSDWNPAMDKQCQDRCHRIGQTRDVHIYRFVSEHTIEANILRKANQKRMLDDVIIQEGEFTTDYFNKTAVREMFGGDVYNGDAEAEAAMDRVLGGRLTGKVFEEAEDQEDIVAARNAEQELMQTDAADFDERAGMEKNEETRSRTEMSAASTKKRAEHTTTLEAAESGLATPDAGIDEEEQESEAGHVEEYMLRLVEWELKDVRVQPAVDRSKKKAKKGAEHGIRKR
ncbi:MAG: hypothetical protein LQ343_002764 [Gyalolechia ehrenbergii]|nr:MAG: hypothetical protein LQ343_002764 [Gyalolechia ehrenbergii]